jgi:hypothetical protein
MVKVLLIYKNKYGSYKDDLEAGELESGVIDKEVQRSEK